MFCKMHGLGSIERSARAPPRPGKLNNVLQNTRFEQHRAVSRSTFLTGWRQYLKVFKVASGFERWHGPRRAIPEKAISRPRGTKGGFPDLSDTSVARLARARFEYHGMHRMMFPDLGSGGGGLEK